MFLNVLMPTETVPMQHDGRFALMSWRDILLHKQARRSGGEGWLLLFVFALWLPLLFLA